MSYCRWSSDNFRCDLYCFESMDDSYITYVARNRVLGEIPKVPELGSVSSEECARAHNAQMKFLCTAERKDIGGPYDGEMFEDKTLEAFRARLIRLREMGYIFPDYVLEDVKAEIIQKALGSEEPIPVGSVDEALQLYLRRKNS